MNTKTKKILKGVLPVVIFIFFVIGLFIPLSYMLRPTDEANIETRDRITGFYAEEKNTLDVVAIGSSAIYRYLNNPFLWEEQKITSYNFAFPGQNIYLIENLIDEIEKTQSPELYIIEVRKFLLSEEDDDIKHSLNTTVNNLKYSVNRCKMINKTIKNPLDSLYYYFDIIQFHSNWEKLSLSSLEYMDNEKKSKLKGWVNIDTVNKVKYTDWSTSKKMKISDNGMDIFNQLLDKIEKEDLNVLFLATPWKSNKMVQMKSNYLCEIIENKGYRYIDLNKEIQNMDIDYNTDFYNGKHMNSLGAEKVTKYIGKYLKKTYKINNQKDKKIKITWDEAAKINNEEVDKIKKNSKE